MLTAIFTDYGRKKYNVIFKASQKCGAFLFYIDFTPIWLWILHKEDKNHSKETGGTRLGLSIVKHAVQFHKGNVSLESEVGKGTTVTVEI